MIDIQNQSLSPKFAIQKVGVRDLAYPFMITKEQLKNPDQSQHPELNKSVQGQWKLYADLAADRRGTHMSRYIGALDHFVKNEVSPRRMYELALELAQRQDSHDAVAQVAFKYFERVQAPVTGISSYLDHEVTWTGRAGSENAIEISMRSAATALCPCSKAISDRGAHNQRSYIKAELKFAPNTETISLARLANILTQSASAQVYPLLKREDEKLLTEQAYDRPQFVEDTCREVALRLTDLPNLQLATFEVQNEESIHNHPCFAQIVWHHDQGSLA